MKKLFTIAMLLGSLTWSTLASAAQIDNIRSSTSPSKVRLVLDSQGSLQYKESFKDKLYTLELPNGQAKVMKHVVKDNLVQGVELKPQGKGSVLTIKLSRNVKPKLLRLQKPDRLVIDFPKIVVMRQDKQLTQGVNYSFLQDDFEGRQIQAHLIAVAPWAKFEWRPFSVAGTYNGRGSLVARAAKLKLPVAVNASYFDRDGWVIGNTKDRGRVMSIETTPRSAFMVNKGKSSVIKDVAYEGQVRLSNGALLDIKGMNRSRIADDLVVYNEYYAPSTKTNHWGREVKVQLKSHRILSVSTLGNMSIEPGTIVVSGHGAAAVDLAKCRIGDQLVYFEKFNEPEAQEAETLIGAGPLLLEEGQVSVRTQEEGIARDIAVGRAPRTAVGIKKDGTTLVLVVDGRSESSAGMTLTELARYLLKQGAWEAVNFDGGGSSEMCINGKIVNRPSDGRERMVAIGMGLFPKR